MLPYACSDLPWDGFGSCKALMSSVLSTSLLCRSLAWEGLADSVALVTFVNPVRIWFFLVRFAIARNFGKTPDCEFASIHKYHLD